MFSELKAIGYKYYTENTVEDLEVLDKNSEIIIIEYTFIQKWLRDNFQLNSTIVLLEKNKWKVTLWKNIYLETLSKYFDNFEDAQKAAIIKMIDYIKPIKS